jgi:hypothetical protein
VGTLGIRSKAAEIHRGVRLEQQDPLVGQESTIDAKIVELELRRELEEDPLYAGKAPLSKIVTNTLLLRCRINPRENFIAVAPVQVPFLASDRATDEDLAANDEETDRAIEPIA